MAIGFYDIPLGGDAGIYGMAGVGVAQVNFEGNYYASTYPDNGNGASPFLSPKGSSLMQGIATLPQQILLILVLQKPSLVLPKLTLVGPTGTIQDITQASAATASCLV